MTNARSKRFLVQRTEHVTYEVELEAPSEDMALVLGCEMLASETRARFVPVETDHTDLTAISLQPTALNLPQRAPAAMVNSSWVSTARPVMASDVAVIVKLLEEVRDTTLSHAHWENAKRLLKQFTE
jgi:hypothetical protein